MAKVKVVCIMGSGHTGSTVLNIVLGNHPNIESIGELHKLPRSGWIKAENRRCACGLPIDQCPYWTEVYQHWTAKVGEGNLNAYISLQHRFEHSRYLWPRLLLESKNKSAHFTKYAYMTAALYEAIRDVSGKDVIVDSSKSPIRNYALLLNNAIDLRLIHLIRDGRGVVWSKMKPHKKNIEAGVPKNSPAVASWQTSLDWILTNLESEWVINRAGIGKSLRVAYEKFIAEPDAVLKQIEPLVNQDLTRLSNALVAGEAMQVGHMAGGNHLRMAGKIALRPDTEWTHKLSPADKRIFWQMAGWLARRYGYTP